MATFAGLFVEIGANIASFVSGMTKMEVLASKTTQKIARDFDKMGAQIGGALAGGAFLYLAKGSIDAMDRLNDLNKTTGISVETLGALGIAAVQSGTDLEGMAMGINRLSVNIGKDAEKFKQLGITAKDPLEALKQLADAYASIEDPQLRAAVAQEALGKSWQNLAPFLKEGSAGITEMIAKNKEWASVTGESAKQADEFNDKMALLFKSGVLMNSLIGPMLPLLNKLADGLLENAKGAKAAADGFQPLLETGKAVTIIVGEFWYVLKAMGTEIGGIAAQLGVLSDAFVKFSLGDFKGAAESLRQFSSIGADMEADAERARAAHDAWVESIMRLGTKGAFAVDELAATYEQASKRIGKGTDSAAKKFLDFNKAQADAKKSAEELAAAVAKMQGFDPNFAKEVELYNRALASGAVSAEDYAKAMTELIAKQPRYAQELKKTLAAAEQLNKEAEDAIDLDERQNRLKNDAVKSLREHAEQLEAEFRTLGMSNAERERSIALLALQKAGFDTTSDSVRDFVNRIAAATQQMEDFYRTRDIVDDLGNRIADIAVAFTESWEKGLTSIKNMARSMWRELVALTAKKWFIQLVAGVTGSTALAAYGEGLGANTVTGAMGSAIGSWLSSTALGQFFTGGGGLGSAFGAGWSSVMNNIAGESTLGTTAGAHGIVGTMGEYAAQAWQWAAANPAIAVAAILVIAGLAISRMRTGGPKPGGSYEGSWSAAGTFLGETGGARLFTPNDQDPAMREMTQGFATNFFSTLRRLGGTAPALNFALGTDQDPRGSADSRVMGRIANAFGDVIFEQLITAGRDNEDLQRGFGQMLSRMTLAGLQASNLPHGIARIFNTVSAATGTQEQIAAVIELGIAFGDLMNVVTEGFTAGGVIEAANRTAVDLFGEQGNALLDLASNTSMTVEDMQRLTAATAEYRNAAAQLIVVYDRLRISITDSIDSMIETVTLAGMTTQQQFDYWQTEANRLFNAMLASNDPAEIERLFGRFQTAWNNAWNLLSPEQQAAEGGDWATRLRTAREAIDTHLTGLASDLADATNEVLTVVGDKMNEAADRFVEAAATNKSATDKFSTAVDKGIDVNVTVDLAGLATEVGGQGG